VDAAEPRETLDARRDPSGAPNAPGILTALFATSEQNARAAGDPSALSAACSLSRCVEASRTCERDSEVGEDLRYHLQVIASLAFADMRAYLLALSLLPTHRK
jgi:hypothetical protein